MSEKLAQYNIIYKFKRADDYASDKKVQPDESLRNIDCGLGSSPFGYPPEVDTALQNITPSLLNEYPNDPYSESLSHLVKDRFHLKKSTSVFFGGAGSYGLLASLLSDMVKVGAIVNGIEVVGAGPQFTNIKILSQRAQIPYHPLTPDIGLPYEEKIDMLIKNRERAYNPAIVYIDNPNNPTGATVCFNTLCELSEATAKKDLLIIDEAYGDAVPDESSAFRLADIYPHVVALRSISKTVGLASPRLGYMAMSGYTAKAYENLQLVFSLDSLTQLIGHAVLQPEVLASFLPKVREMTTQAKCSFTQMLNTHGVETFSTQPSVSILLARANQNFFENLKQINICTESGATFKPTHPAMDCSYVRFRIPADQKDITEIGDRLEMISQHNSVNNG